MARVIAFVERVLASETCEWDGRGGIGRGGVRLTMKCSLFIKPRALSTILVANQFDRCKSEFLRGHAKKKDVRMFMPPSEASYRENWKIKETKRISSVTFSGLY